MLEVTSKDWHINQTRVPLEDSEEYEDYYAYQEKLGKDGCTVDGVYIPGYLYWHINFWHTEVSLLDDKGKVKKFYQNPILRDTEWEIFNAIERAEIEHKGLIIGGARQISKSTIESSYIAHGATFDKDSQNVIAGLNSPDIKVITDKIDKGLNALPSIWQWMRIEDNWNKQVTLGVKDKQGKRYPFSQILMRNVDNGDNEEAIAGTSPSKLIYDEVGKNKSLPALLSARPGFTTKYGWRCSPILTFTSGDMNYYHDAKEMFMNCGIYNFLEYPHQDNPRLTHGLFLGAKYRQEGKVDSNLAEFLDRPDSKILKEISIQVSDEEKSFAITDFELEKLRSAGDSKAFLKEQMYYPKKVEDMFVSNASNLFNAEAIKKQIANIDDNELFGSPVELYNDGSKITWKHSDKKQIIEFPLPKGFSTDCPVVIYEHPIPNAPWGLYTAGVDDIIGGDSDYVESLFSIYVYKRMHKITGEGYQNSFVAKYTARIEDKEKMYEQARLLIKYYNAQTLVENNVLGFIDFMKSKREAIKYLAAQPTWLKSYATWSTQNRDFGLSRSSEKVRNLLHSDYKKYLDEVIHTEYNEDGTIKEEIVGVSRMFSRSLLKESLLFDGIINVDELIAAELALRLANDLDPLIGVVSSVDEDPRFKSYFNREKKHSSKLFNNINLGLYRKK